MARLSCTVANSLINGFLKQKSLPFINFELQSLFSRNAFPVRHCGCVRCCLECMRWDETMRLLLCFICLLS
jgi:hypothetical protein